MRMKESDTLKDYSTRLSDLVNNMKVHGEKITDKRIVEKVLISLPEKFDSMVAVIEETKDLTKLSVQELLSSLKSHEQRLERHSEKSIESVFQSKLNFNSSTSERKSEQKEEDSFGRGGQGRGRGKNQRCRSTRHDTKGSFRSYLFKNYESYQSQRSMGYSTRRISRR